MFSCAATTLQILFDGPIRHWPTERLHQLRRTQLEPTLHSTMKLLLFAHVMHQRSGIQTSWINPSWSWPPAIYGRFISKFCWSTNQQVISSHIPIYPMYYSQLTMNKHESVIWATCRLYAANMDLYHQTIKKSIQRATPKRYVSWFVIPSIVICLP